MLIAQIFLASLNTEAFGATTVHFINKNWELVSKVLGTKIFEGQHTAEAISRSLAQIMNEWNIDPKGVTGVTDNAANECKAFEILGWGRVSCSGHNLNLAVSSALKINEISRIMRKGASIVAYFHRSPLATSVLFEKQKLLLQPKCHGHKLISDVATRWNSSLDMLEHLSEQVPALHAAVHDPTLAKVSTDLKSKLFSYDKHLVVDQIIKLLKLFKTATVSLSSETVPTSAFVLPTMIKLENHLEIKGEDHKLITKMKNEMVTNLKKRFPQPQRQILLLSSVLHPRIKDLNFLSPNEKTETKQLLLEKCKLRHLGNDPETENVSATKDPHGDP